MIHKDILLMFSLFVVGDIVTTHYAILSGGYEAHSFTSAILNMTHGIYILFLIKSLVIGWVWFCKIKLVDYKFAWNCVQLAIYEVGIVTTINNLTVILTGYDMFCLGTMCLAMFSAYLPHM